MIEIRIRIGRDSESQIELESGVLSNLQKGSASTLTPCQGGLQVQLVISNALAHRFPQPDTGPESAPPVAS